MLRHLLRLIALFIAVGVAASFVLRNGVDSLADDVSRLFGPGRTKVGGSCFPDDHNFTLTTRRTLESWLKGGESVSFTLTVDADEYLKAFLLYAAQDADDDGVIDESEWTLLCTGSIHESSGRTVALIGETHVDRRFVAYRVVTDDWKWGRWYTQWGRSDLKYFDP